MGFISAVVAGLLIWTFDFYRFTHNNTHMHTQTTVVKGVFEWMVLLPRGLWPSGLLQSYTYPDANSMV